MTDSKTATQLEINFNTQARPAKIARYKEGTPDACRFVIERIKP